MVVVHFYAWVIRLGLALAIIGQLKSCTLVMLGTTAEKAGHGIISYSNFSRQLTR